MHHALQYAGWCMGYAVGGAFVILTDSFVYLWLTTGSDAFFWALQTAKKEGCNLLTGDGRPPHKNDGGFWVQPTVFTGVEREHTIWREEIFGPVLAATTFSTEEEALALANESEFGLGAAVISADLQVLRQILTRHVPFNMCNGKLERLTTA